MNVNMHSCVCMHGSNSLKAAGHACSHSCYITIDIMRFNVRHLSQRAPPMQQDCVDCII